MTGPSEHDRDRDIYHGGADAVNDTPDVPGRGTSPGDTERRGVPRATGTGGRGLPLLGWLAILLAVAMILLYGFGIFG